MASLRKMQGKYASRKTHLGRCRDQNGKEIEFTTDIPVEPPDLLLTDPNYAKAKADLEKLATEEVNDVESRIRGKMTAEEYEARARYRAKKILKENVEKTYAAFIVGWLWEHSLRNRLDYTKTQAICRCIKLLLQKIAADKKCKTIHDVKGKHFDETILEMRMNSYAPSVVNNAIVYLTALERAIAEQTGNKLTLGLNQEQTDYDERQPFTVEEIQAIFDKLDFVAKPWAVEWKLFLLVMLYTEMRPSDSAKVTRNDINLEQDKIRVKSTKTRGFRSKFESKPMHRTLSNFLTAFLSEVQLEPGDYLCKHLANMSEKSLGNQFRKILCAANIDQKKVLKEHRKLKFSSKCLYSVKHTASVWLDFTGGRDDEQEEHADKTVQAQAHYKHTDFFDPVLLETRRKKINRMPAINVSYKQK